MNPNKITHVVDHEVKHEPDEALTGRKSDQSINDAQVHEGVDIAEDELRDLAELEAGKQGSK